MIPSGEAGLPDPRNSRVSSSSSFPIIGDTKVSNKITYAKNSE
jgi:hypothetical protein